MRKVITPRANVPPSSEDNGRVGPGLRIAYFITGLAYGGAEVQLVRLASGIASCGAETSIISMMPPTAFSDELRDCGVSLYNLGMRRGTANPMHAVGFVRLLRRIRPQILHCVMFHANIVGRMLRLFHRVPVVISSMHTDHDGGGLRDRLYGLTDRLADITTHVSRLGRERYIRINASPPDKIIHMPNSVDIARFANNPVDRKRMREKLGIQDKFAWIAVGRFFEAKDHRNMIEAFFKAAKSSPITVLLLAGAGPLEDETRSLCLKFGLRERVLFLGVREDVPELLNAADAYLLSSAWEGGPIVLLEAASVCLPIVATDVGSAADIVEKGVTGYIVPPKDPEALARAMSKIHSFGRERLSEMGKAGREKVAREYRLERIVDKWLDLYGALLKKKKRVEL